MTNRLQMLNSIQPLIGTYFSNNYVKKNILRMSDEEIIKMDNEIQVELAQQPQQSMLPAEEIQG